MRSDVIKVTCPRCLGTAYLTTWKPPQGIDAEMREFRHRGCFVFYARLSPPKLEVVVTPSFAVNP